MSLVGPRPERPEIAEQILQEVPDFDLRCLVRPGMAGLAQSLVEYDSRPAVKLRYAFPEVHRPYVVPWGMTGLWVSAALTTLWIALGTEALQMAEQLGYLLLGEAHPPSVQNKIILFMSI